MFDLESVSEWFRVQDEYFITNHQPKEFKIFHRSLGVQVGVSRSMRGAIYLAYWNCIKSESAATRKLIEISKEKG